MTNSKGKIAISALIAGVIGYGVGILTAPKSGKETRGDVKVAAQNYSKKAEQRLENYHNELTQLLAEAKIAGLNYRGKARIELDKLLAVAVEARHRVSLAINALQNGDKIDIDIDDAITEADESIKKLKNFAEKDN